MKLHFKHLIPLFASFFDLIQTSILTKIYKQHKSYPTLIALLFLPLVTMIVSHSIMFLKRKSDINQTEMLFGGFIACFYVITINRSFSIFENVSNKIYNFSEFISIINVTIITELLLGRKIKHELLCILGVSMSIVAMMHVFWGELSNNHNKIKKKACYFKILTSMISSISYYLESLVYIFLKYITANSFDPLNIICAFSTFTTLMGTIYYYMDSSLYMQHYKELCDEKFISTVFFFMHGIYRIFEFILLFTFSIEVFYVQKLFKIIILSFNFF